MNNVINTNNTTGAISLEGNTRDMGIITLKEITDMLGKRHNDAMRIVDGMAKEPSFGVLRKIRTVPKGEKGGRPTDTYSLTKKQAIAVGARLDTAMLMKVINRLEELEAANKPKPLTRKELAYMVIEAEEAKEKALLAQKVAEDKVAILTHSNHLYRATEIAKELGMKSAIALNNKLRDDKIQYKTNGTWVLYAKYSSMGLTSIKQHQLENGKIIYDRRWTGLGREFLLEKYGE